MANPQRVTAELQRLAAVGESLNSGYNRGGWLYAAALVAFGTWAKAVEAAGFTYDDIVIRPLTKPQVLARIKALVASGAPPVATTQEPRLVAAACRHFGTWGAAVKAAGGVMGPKKWTPARVVEAIRADVAAGLAMNTMAVIARNWPLYQAGRRRFGTWALALGVAGAIPLTAVSEAHDD